MLCNPDYIGTLKM